MGMSPFVEVTECTPSRDSVLGYDAGDQIGLGNKVVFFSDALLNFLIRHHNRLASFTAHNGLPSRSKLPHPNAARTVPTQSAGMR